MTTQAEHYSINSQSQKEDGLKLIGQLRPEKSCKILDLGCGTGYLSSVLAERVGPGGKVIGVDPDNERVRVAHEKYSASNLVFLEGSGEDFPEDQYDIVFSNYVLHWIKDKESVLKKVYQNLKPGGRFAFIAPLVTTFPKILHQLCDLMGPDISKHIMESNYFVPFEAYEEMAVSQCGFLMKFKESCDKVMTFLNIEALIDWWFATTHGVFDPTLIDAVTLDGFVKRFRDKPVQFDQSHAIFILSRPI